MEQEIWKPVPGYEGFYEVSTLGKIRSLKRVVVRKNGTLLTLQERIMTACANGSGYLTTGLSKDGILETNGIHYFVALSFLEKTEGAIEINHKDGNKANNNVSNLEWVSSSDNIQHLWDNGLRKRKINQSSVDKIFQLRKVGTSFNNIAKAVGISKQYVMQIFKGTRLQNMNNKLENGG